MAKVLLEETSSATGTCKAEIWRWDDGMFQVRVLRWTEEMAAEQGEVASTWSEITSAGSITDSIDIARGLATGLLARHS
jgi:hypothetical protein